MNAATLGMLVHMYHSPPEEPYPYKGSPGFIKDCRKYLHFRGLIDRPDELGIITAKGRVHVEALLEAPLPEEQWISPICKVLRL
jgi:hypothetical protein